ncbi:MAG: PAS domain-containing protein, partial [Promethearchaeota archaeon]
MSEKDNKLEINDELYKKIYKSISNQIYIWRKFDDDLILIDYNNATEEITEGRIKDYVGRKATELYKDQPHILNELFNCANAQMNISKEMEYKYITTGEEKYLALIFNIISPDLVLVQTEDITNNKKAEEIIKKEEQEKSIILENIKEHIVYQDLDHTIIYLNKAACDSVNKVPEELIGYKCHEIWNNSVTVCENCPVEKSFKTKKPERNEMITPDGRVWIVQGIPIQDERGNLIAGVEVTTEVTEQRKMERKLKQSELKYREAYNSSSLYKDLFTHDINNIFQNILSSIELYKLYRK